MKLKYFIFCILFGSNSRFLLSQDLAKLSISSTPGKVLIITLQPKCHLQYGVMIPITYQLEFPSGQKIQNVLEKHRAKDEWSVIKQKLSGDVFNDIEAVRLDDKSHIAYTSASFSNASDTIYLKLINKKGQNVSFKYKGICKYYDNRKAVVTVTSDDWGDFVNSSISPLFHLFRSRGIYHTFGIMSFTCNDTTWHFLQQELDSGFVEAGSHSRTHPHVPYLDAIGEVQGSSNDIKQHLKLPAPYSSNGKNYVYSWIAPYGNYDKTVDSIVGISGYLVPRLYENLDTTGPREYVYGDSTLKKWNKKTNHFNTCFPTVEIGAPDWGGGDTSLVSLNKLFDTIVAKGDVYHLMWHPEVIIKDLNKRYLTEHLNYISGHSNIWYVTFGNLYLYHFIQEANMNTVIKNVAENKR